MFTTVTLIEELVGNLIVLFAAGTDTTSVARKPRCLVNGDFRRRDTDLDSRSIVIYIYIQKNTYRKD